jgi:serine/threonine-protein kinase
VGLVVGAVIASLAFWLLIQPSSPEQQLKKFTITPSLDVPMATRSSNDLAISPDGRHLIYKALSATGNQLSLRSLDDLVDKPIPGTEGVSGDAFFSPDGESVAFFTAASLKKISLVGGSPVTLCDAPGPGSAKTGSWGSEGTIVFSAGAGAGGVALYRVSSVGGEPELLATPDLDQGEDRYFAPRILPDGENVLFSIRYPAAASYQIAVLSLETKEQKNLLANGRQAHYLPTGHLVYELSATGNLVAVPFDLARLEVTGEPVPIVEGVRQTRGDRVDYSVSQEGTLVYVPGQTVAENTLVWVDREGRETLVTKGERAYTTPRISPDGKRIALAFFEDDGNRNIWIYDIERDSFSRATFEGSDNAPVIWTPDGNWITFQSNRDGPDNLYHKAADGSGPAERLTTSEVTHNATSWTPDGKVLAFYTLGTDPRQIWLLPMEGERKPQLLMSSDACCVRFSPDGHWLAYVSSETGRKHVYVRPYPEARGKWLVSGEEGGGEPLWSHDGTELFYRSGPQMERMMAVSVRTEPTFSAETPRVLFEGSYKISASVPGDNPYYDIFPDGQRFLMIKEEQVAGQINVVLNWFEELKRLVPIP